MREKESLRIPFFKLFSRLRGSVLDAWAGAGPKLGAFCNDRLEDCDSTEGNAIGGVSMLSASESNAYSSGTTKIFSPPCSECGVVFVDCSSPVDDAEGEST